MRKAQLTLGFLVGALISARSRFVPSSRPPASESWRRDLVSLSTFGFRTLASGRQKPKSRSDRFVVAVGGEPPLAPAFEEERNPGDL